MEGHREQILNKMFSFKPLLHIYRTSLKQPLFVQRFNLFNLIVAPQGYTEHTSVYPM